MFSASDISALLQQTADALATTDPSQLEQEYQQLEQQTYAPDFWQKEGAAAIMQSLSAIKVKLEQIKIIRSLVGDIKALTELQQETDQSAASTSKNTLDELNQELTAKTAQLATNLKIFELEQFLGGPYDRNSAFLSIHSGQGGTEAMDWADMLKRMYIRYFERKGWKYVQLSESPGEEAGIKEVSFEVTAPFAYGYLKGEGGTHRLVRLSPFNADSLRQTSFALVEILPAIENEADIPLKDEELEWKFSRSGGAGGQNVNKVNSAVELHHLPSGLVVRCREERSQAQNKERALKILKAKLAKLEEEKQANELAAIKGEHVHASWGNQIRNYVLHPYQLVKDTRTELETSDTQGVLDGDLDAFIAAEVKWLKQPSN